jgi:hypothetical protein
LDRTTLSVALELAKWRLSLPSPRHSPPHARCS